MKCLQEIQEKAFIPLEFNQYITKEINRSQTHKYKKIVNLHTTCLPF